MIVRNKANETSVVSETKPIPKRALRAKQSQRREARRPASSNASVRNKANPGARMDRNYRCGKGLCGLRPREKNKANWQVLSVKFQV